MISDTMEITQINKLKIKMGELWDERGRTDPEILGLSIKIDQLLNQYYPIKLDLKKSNFDSVSTF